MPPRSPNRYPPPPPRHPHRPPLLPQPSASQKPYYRHPPLKRLSKARATTPTSPRWSIAAGTSGTNIFSPPACGSRSTRARITVKGNGRMPRGMRFSSHEWKGVMIKRSGPKGGSGGGGGGAKKRIMSSYCSADLYIYTTNNWAPKIMNRNFSNYKE